MYEDDVVVLELQPDARTQDEEGQRKETVVLGYIKGEHCFLAFKLKKMFLLSNPRVTWQKLIFIQEANGIQNAVRPSSTVCYCDRNV